MQEASSAKPILSVRDLSVRFRLRGQSLHAIRGVSLDVYPGESLALVGESGCGKSVLNKNFIGLLDNNGYIDQGQIRYYAMSGMPSAPDGALYLVLDIRETDGEITIVPVAVYPKKYLDQLEKEIGEVKAKVAAGEQPVFDSVDALFKHLEGK